MEQAAPQPVRDGQSKRDRTPTRLVTAFRYPGDPSFRFEDFYHRLRARRFVIYPGKSSQADCFQIGTIGRINEKNMRDLVGTISEVPGEIGR